MVRLQVWLVMAAALVALTLGLGFFTGAGSADETVRDGVFVHVTAGPDAPKRVFMACTMADVMAADHDVLMYFDIEGVQAVLESNAAAEGLPRAPMHEKVAALLAKGVTVMVCPSCLAKAGLAPEAVQKGVKIADKNTFFDFTKGRILTIDY